MTIHPITKHFSPSSSSDRSKQEEKLKILISQGKNRDGDSTTRLQIFLKNNDGRNSKRPAPAANSEPEVVCLSGDDSGDEGQATKAIQIKEDVVRKKVKLETVVSSPLKEVKKEASLVEKAVQELLLSCRGILPAQEYSAVEAKLNKRLSTLNEWDLNSEKLAKVVLAKKAAVDNDHETLFLHLRVLLDEFKKCQRKQQDCQQVAPQDIKVEPVNVSGENLNGDHGDVAEAGPSKPRVKKEASEKQVKKLEKALRLCHEAIVRIDSQEVNLDDEDDSAYLRADRYRKKMLQIYKKLAEIKKCGSTLGRREERKFRFEGSRYPEVNHKIEKFVRERRRAKQEVMPDYPDILELLRETNVDKCLRLSPDEVDEEAKSIFKAVCQKLRSRRVQDTQESLDSWGDVPVTEGSRFGEDPADNDELMRERLEANRALKEEKEQEVSDAYFLYLFFHLPY